MKLSVQNVTWKIRTKDDSWLFSSFATFILDNAYDIDI